MLLVTLVFSKMLLLQGKLLTVSIKLDGQKHYGRENDCRSSIETLCYDN